MATSGNSSKKIEGKKEELRILLIGKTGDGKSHTGNTILGSKVFQSEKSPASVTVNCKYALRERFGRNILVVDTPGLCDTKVPNDEIFKELLRSYGFSYPGFHVIIYVLRSDRFTEECVKTKELFFKWFGEDVKKHAMMILTNFREDVEGNPADFCEKEPELKAFLESCGNRIVGIDNRGPETEKESMVQKIISVIEEITKQNSYYTSENLKPLEQKLNIGNTGASSNVEETRAKFEDDSYVNSLFTYVGSVFDGIASWIGSWF